MEVREKDTEWDLESKLEVYQIKYRQDMMESLKSGDSDRKLFSNTAFTLHMMEEYVQLYEKKFPERKRAFSHFFCRTDKQLTEHMVKIKGMTYMLDEEIVCKMTRMMKRIGGISIKMFPYPNPVPNGASAYFGRDFWGRPRIMYYDISAKSQLHPPYKTFFHEFGHGLDGMSGRGKRFLSDQFQYTKQAAQKQLDCGPFTGHGRADAGICIIEKTETKTRTIHEWAEFDVRNFIIQTAADFIQSKVAGNSPRRYLDPAVTAQVHCQMADFITHRLFLQPDGREQLAALSGKPYADAVCDLYQDIAEIINKKVLGQYCRIIVLPKDLFGGITNNQLGGGHGGDYWFRGNKRVNTISKEAFAGYFEYRTTIADPVFRQNLINPYHCMPNTVEALEAMLDEMVKRR